MVSSQVAPALTACALLLLIGGSWILMWNGDGGGPFPVVLIHPLTTTAIVVLAAVGIGAMFLGRSRKAVLWIAVGATGSAAFLTWATRRSILVDAASVDEYVRIEGSVAGVSNPVTRAVSGQVTDVDPRVFAASWGLGVVLLILGCALVAVDIWRRRGA